VRRPAVALAVPGSGPAGERHRLAVGREAGVLRVVERELGLPPTFDRYGVQFRTAGEGRAPGRRENDVLAIRRPAEGGVVSGIEGEPPRLTAVGRADEYVVLPVPVGREGDPVAVRAEH